MNVFVGGLQFKQEQRVRVPPGVKVSFYQADSFARWGEAAAHYDRVILMTRYVSHRHHHILRSAGVKYIPCNGAVSALNAILEGL